MKITLYRNCILNDNYNEVFSLGVSVNSKSVLENYLDTLSSITYSLNDTYYENSGEFVIDLEVISSSTAHFNIYSFNYLKFDDENTSTYQRIIRYCFIKDIKVKNGVVYISYEEDLWHSYSSQISKITDSYYCRTRVRKYQSFTPTLLELPKDYDGNNKLDINNFMASESVYILVEIQQKEITSPTTTPTLKPINYYLYRHPIYSQTNNSYKIYLNSIDDALFQLISGMPTQLIGSFNYEIGDIYILNENFDLENKLYFESEQAVGTVGYIKKIRDYQVVSQSISQWALKGVQLKSGTIANDYKNLFIGTFDKNIKIINNGTDIDYEIIFYKNASNISIQLRCLNQILDITESFKYEIPCSMILSQEYAQRVIGYNLEKYKIGMQTSQLSTSSMLSKGSDFLTSLGNIITGGFLHNFSGLMNQGNKMRQTYGSALDTLNYDIPILKEQEKAISAPQYSNQKGIFGNYNYIDNYYNGVFIAKINSDNDTFVKDCINNFGYITYQFIRNYANLQINDPNYFLNLTTPIRYNVLRFEKINVCGSFPLNIAESLNNMFKNGIKIWFDYLMRSDTYVV